MKSVAAQFSSILLRGWWLLLRGDNECLLPARGLASVATGVILVARPGAGALEVLWVIGFYAIVFGALLLILALRVREPAGRLM